MPDRFELLELPEGQSVQLRQSFGRCCLSTGFFDEFYDLFIASSPEVAKRFANTDLNKQKEMLKESLAWMVMSALGNDHANGVVGTLAERHSRRSLDIQPHLYDFWLESLMTAIESHDRRNFKDLEKIWRTLLSKAIEFMKSQY